MTFTLTKTNENMFLKYTIYISVILNTLIHIRCIAAMLSYFSRRICILLVLSNSLMFFECERLIMVDFRLMVLASFLGRVFEDFVYSS